MTSCYRQLLPLNNSAREKEPGLQQALCVAKSSRAVGSPYMLCIQASSALQVWPVADAGYLSESIWHNMHEAEHWYARTCAWKPAKKLGGCCNICDQAVNIRY